jgi:hypothetical protein
MGWGRVREKEGKRKERGSQEEAKRNPRGSQEEAMSKLR